MGASAGTSAARDGRCREVRFVHRLRALGPGAAAPGEAPDGTLLDVSIVLDGTDAAPGSAQAGLRAGARFLIDVAHGAVAPAELARMIGCLAFAVAARPGQRAAEVTVRGARGPLAVARLRRPAFAVEANGFGAAHVLCENASLGLYLLALAPGRAIPAHFHRLMREAELVLDPGLLLQGRPVGAGDAFVWPAGRVHEYANPTRGPGRILCIDRPKFIPEDEVVVSGPVDLVAVAPARNYLA
ncbi:MAG TPA: cupin domain-containing protein [Thermohalobaculum sp.]|nr:cupin domain-containing protein [Thermohalobaculum sp.]